MKQLVTNIETFYLALIPELLKLNEFRTRLDSIDFGSDEQNRQSSEQKLKSYIKEAALIVHEISPHLKQDQSILEVGGGIGLVYLWLKKCGFNVCSIEPSGLGHNGYYEMGEILAQHLAIDRTGWLNISAAQLPTLNRTFDFIFSHNVVEHLQPLHENMAAMHAVLSQQGMMLHQFPNYLVPYDPHFGIPLVPVKPNTTARILPKLRNNPLWLSLNFINTVWLQRWSKDRGLEFAFKRGHWFESVLRLNSDREFRNKHAVIYLCFNLLERIGFNVLLRKLPDHLTTPVQVILRRP